MSFNRVTLAVAILLVLGLGITSAPQAQAQGASCDQTYTVVAGDTLASIAQKLLGDLHLYQQIADATNAANKVDSSYASISDVNKIEVGQKLCIPAKSAAAATTTPGAAATPAPSVAPLALDQLGNVTIMASDAPSGTVTLQNGKASVPQAPGSASMYTAQIMDPVANGTLGGKPYAAANLVTSGGGSGTFYNVAVFPNNSGKPGTGVSALIGDRVQVNSIAFRNDTVQVGYLDRAPSDPMTVTPTIAMTKTFSLNSAGDLVEGNAGSATATATPPPGSLEGTYLASLPAADASGLLETLFLGPNGNAAETDLYVGKLTSEKTGSWIQDTENTATVTFIHQDGNNIGQKLVFQLSGSTLTATEWDKGAYGDTPPTFYVANASLTGTVTYLQKSALPDDAVFEVYLIDTDKAGQPGEYLSGISNTTHGDQVPLSFTIPYAPSQINSAGHYAVQAFISQNGTQLFKNDAGVPVITNGAPTSNISITVTPP